MDRPTVVLGAGAQARDTYDWVCAAGGRVAGFFATVGGGRTLRGLPVWERPEDIPDGLRWVPGVGRPRVLQDLAAAVSRRIEPAPAVVHPSAVLGTDVILDPGVVLGPGTMTSCDVTFQGPCIAMAAVVGHDATIGRWSVLAPRSFVAGRATVGPGCFIGAGSIVLPASHVAPETILGAGAVASGMIGPGVVAGNPASRIRDLHASERLAEKTDRRPA